MTSSRVELGLAGLKGRGASCRGWVLRPAGPTLWGRGSAPPSLGADCALRAPEDRPGRAGLGWASLGQGSRSLAGVGPHAFQFSRQDL